MALRLVHVDRRFGRQAALEDLSLWVRRGDCYGFLGHNGAGKTTAMRIALGLHRPTRGEILVDGFDARRFPREARARIGALIEVPGFHGGWSGAKNLDRLARLSGMSAAEARAEADRLLALVGLGYVGKKSVRAYSHGMRQRLGIAQAMIGGPEILLLDEPTNGLDPEGIAEIRALLRRLVRDEGLTVLVSSHQLAEITGLVDRIGVLRRGRLVAEDTREELLGGAEGRYRVATRDADDGEARLAELDLAPVRRDDGVLLVRLGDRRPEDVVRALVDAGAGIVAFAPEPPTLEEIYLRHTREGASTGVKDSEPPRDETPVALDARPAESRAPRGSLRRVLGYELARWRSGPGVALLLAAPLLLAIVAVLRRRADALEHAREIEGQTLYSTTGVTAFEGVGLALQAGLPLLAVVVLGLTSQQLAGELARGTLRNVLLRPLTRLQVCAGKALAALVVTLGAYVVLVATSVAAGAWAFDFGDVVEVLPNGAVFPLVPSEELWPELRAAVVAPLLPLAAFAGLGLFASSVTRSGAAALGLALALGVALDLSRVVLRAFDAEQLVPWAYLPSPLGDTSFQRMYVDVSQGVSNAAFDFAATSVSVPLAWALVCFVLASLVLQRRSIP